MEGPGKDWSPEWGKGPARLPGVRQEGRERGEGQPPRKRRRYWDDAETFPDPRPARPPRAGAASERGTFQGSGKKTLPEYKE